jgi:hypothetical protein
MARETGRILKVRNKVNPLASDQLPGRLYETVETREWVRVKRGE